MLNCIGIAFAVSADHSLASAEADSAVALAEQSAACVSFQRHQPNHPPAQNVHSAVGSLNPAMHFSGKVAIFATFTTFLSAA